MGKMLKNPVSLAWTAITMEFLSCFGVFSVIGSAARLVMVVAVALMFVAKKPLFKVILPLVALYIIVDFIMVAVLTAIGLGAYLVVEKSSD